jgi:hypothetical protein
LYIPIASLNFHMWHISKNLVSLWLRRRRFRYCLRHRQLWLHFRNFPLSFEVNAKIVLWIRPRPLPSTYIPILHSLWPPSFHAKQHGLLTASLNELQTNKSLLRHPVLNCCFSLSFSTWW